MNVVIVGELNGFPQGMAAPKLVLLEGMGLVRVGVGVHVIPVYFPQNSAGFDPCCGCTQGVNWEYLGGVSVRPPTKWGRFLLRIVTDTRISRRLSQLRQEGKMDVLMYIGRSFLQTSLCARVAQRLKLPFVVQLHEWPLALPAKSTSLRLNNKLFCAKLGKLATAYVVISRYLEERVARILRQHSEEGMIHRMPILANREEWEGIEPVSCSKPYVLYCASLDAYTDDALFVIGAVAGMDDSDIDLIMVGKTSEKTERCIRQFTDSVGMSDRIVLETEYVPTKRLHSLYAGAEALLAPLSDDDRSKARFPSKIADYLMSASPVVSSAVGEVAHYLVDGSNAFLSQPGNMKGFTRKIKEALAHPDRETIGLRGKELAVSEFDFREQGRRLREFLETVKTFEGE